MNTNKELLYLLIQKIENVGTKIEKRHGFYYHVRVYDNYSLIIDSWNKSIEVRKDNKRIDNISIDFGGFRCDIDAVRFWLGHSCLFTPCPL